MSPPSPSITNGSITSCLTCRNCKLEHIVYYGITPPHSLYLFYYHWQINGSRRAFSLWGACWWSDAEVEGVLLFWSMVQYNIRLTTFQCTREEVASGHRSAMHSCLVVFHGCESHTVDFPRVSSGHHKDWSSYQDYYPPIVWLFGSRVGDPNSIHHNHHKIMFQFHAHFKIMITFSRSSRTLSLFIVFLLRLHHIFKQMS